MFICSALSACTERGLRVRLILYERVFSVLAKIADELSDTFSMDG